MTLNNDQNSHENKFCYRYPHPAVTADCVIFGFDGEKLKLLLIERGQGAYIGMWALPGGFLKMDETIEECAQRELAEETGLKNMYLTQFKVYSAIDRDPRERVVTVAFLALVRQKDVMQLTAGDDARSAAWFDIDQLPPLAFDHDIIIGEARTHLSELLRQSPVGFALLDDIFSMSELQNVYEAVTGGTFDRRNFQRKVMQTNIIEDAGIERRNSASRPAKLYSLRKEFNLFNDDTFDHEIELECCCSNASEMTSTDEETTDEDTATDSNSLFSLKRWFNF